MLQRLTVVFVLSFALVSGLGADSAGTHPAAGLPALTPGPSPLTPRLAEPVVTPIPEAIIKKFDLDTEFYKKHVDYKGFSILSSSKVSDKALFEAYFLI